VNSEVWRRRSGARILCAVLCAALAAAPALPVQAQIRLPALGEAAGDEFSVGAEKRLGEQIMREIRRDPDYLDDPLLLEYVDSIWTRLVAAGRQRGEIGTEIDKPFAWEAFLVRDRSVNAFALPGGYIGVHLGLIAMTATRDELASVLAHEMSHITQRHIARASANASRQGAVALAAMILGVIAASRSRNPDAAQAAVVGGQAAMAQGQLNFSRDMEREADRIGMNVLTSAGFAPSGMAQMFDKLDTASRHNDSGGFPYLRSHPLTVERIGEARARMSLQGAMPTEASDARLLEHSLMQARARVLADPAVLALRRAQEQDERAELVPAAERPAAYYGSALASLQLRDFARADKALSAAQTALGPTADARALRALTMLRLQSALAQADLARARTQAERLDADGSRAAMLLLAQYALAAPAAGGAKRSAESLQTWVADHPHDASAWALLAQCAQAQGFNLRALRAEAESHAANGDLQGGIDRLRAAQRLARSGTAGVDFVEVSVIDVRLRELLSQQRQLMAEARGQREPLHQPH
jgi:predicted Zn-dependent protease